MGDVAQSRGLLEAVNLLLTRLAADHAQKEVAEPLHRFLGYHATVRASFAFYNDKTDVDRLVGSLSTVRGRMGYDD